MKSRLLGAVTALVLLLTSGNLFAQIDSLEIGTGTSSSTSYGMYCYYANSMNEFIYTPSEMGVAKTLTGLQLYKNSGTSNATITNVKIYLKNTTVADFPTTTLTDYSDFTLVYTGDFPNNITAGWMGVAFNSNYDYDGVSNLHVLIVRENSNAITSGNPSWRYTSTSPDYRSRYAYNSSSLASITSMTRTTSRGNMKFIYNIGPMSFLSAAGAQPLTSPVLQGMLNAEIFRVNIKTTGQTAPKSVSSFTFNTNGTTNPATALNKARLYYTGADPNLVTTTQYGSEITSPSGNMVFTEAKILNPGDNYFWLVYDVKVTSSPGNYIDAELTDVSLSTGSVAFTGGVQIGKRKIAGPMTGTYTIGTGGTFDYSSLSEAFTDINMTGLGGNVTLVISTDITETTVPELNEWAEAGVGNYTLTIRPDGNTLRTISHSITSRGVIELNGADRVIIDGKSSVVGANPHCLKIINNYSGAGAGIWIKSLGTGAGANNIVIQNAIISCGINSTSTTFGILSSGTTYGTGSPYAVDSDGLVIANNKMYKSYYGIRAYAPGTSDEYTGLVITNNEFGDPLDASNSIYYYNTYTYYTNGMVLAGNKYNNTTYYNIYCYYANNATVTGNTINLEVPTAATSISGYGIYMPTCTTATISGNNVTQCKTYGIYATKGPANIIGNEVHNCNVTSNSLYGIYGSQTAGFEFNVKQNKIYDLNNTYTSGGVSGIYVYAGSTNTESTPFNVENNMIWDIDSYGYNSTTYFYYNPNGILVYYGKYINILNNTILMNGNMTLAAGSSAALRIAYYSTTTALGNITVKNNLLVNNTTGPDAASYYSIYVRQPEHIDAISNNIYDVSGASNGMIGNAGVNATTMQEWMEAMPADATSKNAVATLGSPIPYLSGNSAVSGQFFSPEVLTSTDFAGEARTVLNNAIGADAVTFNGTVSLAQDLPTAMQYKCLDDNANYSISLNVAGTFADGYTREFTNPVTSLNVNWFRNGDPIPYNPSVSPSTNNYYVLTDNNMNITKANGTHDGTYYATTSLFGQNFTSSNMPLEVQIPITITVQPISTLGCSTLPTVDVSCTATGTINGYRLEKQSGSNWNTVVSGSESTITMNISPATNGMYRFVVMGPGKCGAAEVVSDEFEVRLDNPVSNFTITPSRSTEEMMSLCEGESLVVSSHANGTILGYQWYVFRNGTWVELIPIEFPTSKSSELHLDGLRPEMSGRYRLTVIGSPACASDPSLEFEIKVYPSFEFVMHPENKILCEGDDVVLGTVGEGTVNSYQWLKDGIPVSVAENATANQPFFMISKANYKASASYTCMLNVTDCHGTYDISSNPGEIYVIKGTEITREPSNAKAYVGNKAMFVVQAHNKGKLPPFYQDKYRWYRFNSASNSYTELADNGRIMGAHSSVLNFNQVETSDFTAPGDGYVVVITGTCGADTSKVVSLTEGESITIVSQPNGSTICEGSNVSLDVMAQASNPSASLVYQWYFDDKVINDNLYYTGTETAALNINSADPALAGKYSVKVSYSTGEAEEMSDYADIMVNLQPFFTLQPDAAITVDKDKDLIINCAADGTAPFAYQWYKDGVEIIGAIDPVYTKTLVDMPDAGIYTVKVSNACGEITSIDCAVTVTKTNHSSVGETIDGFTLEGVVPNPANDNSFVNLSLNKGQYVKITVIDAAGREMLTLNDGFLAEGAHKIGLKNELTSGVYFVVARTALGIVTANFTVVK